MSDKYPGGFLTANAPAGFSVAFDGTGDYLSVAGTSTACAFGTGDFTVEFWFWNNATTLYGNLWSTTASIDTTNGIRIMSGNSNNTLQVGTALTALINSSTAFANNTWVHVAVVRSGTTLRLYQNGLSVGSATNSQSFVSDTFTMGNATGTGSPYALNGYISNLRVLKGTALYSGTSTTTANFNLPTQLFPITNTQLLVCQSPTIIDNSTNAFTVTANGDAKVSNFTPFAGYTGFNPALGAAAGGVWTLDQAEYYQANRQWPIYDPYFKNTTLMLHGNGTNGAQNNTFLDSSTNNFTITRNGNTTQGTFTPFSQTGWSNYLGGASYLQNTSISTALQIGTSNFTVEFWIYPTTDQSSLATVAGVGSIGTAAAGNMSFGVRNASTGQIKLWFGTWTTDNYSTTTFAPNAWYHVAFVRSGTSTNQFKMYVNGINTDSFTVADNFSNYSTLVIGATINSISTSGFIGYISNLRVTNGGALYSSNFTPSAIPLTTSVSSGTVALLTCQSNRFVDNSVNAYNVAATVSGTPSVQAFSPFVPAYITPTTYSNRFAATSYLSIASNAAFALPGAFTIEFWIYFSTFEAANRLIAGVQTAGGLTFYTNGTTISPNIYGTGNIFTASNTVVAGQWYHYALSRDASNNMRMWVNGLSVGSTTTATSYAQGAYQINDSAGSMAFVISNLREVKGSTVYDPTQTNITPPTAPLTAITNTQLLTCQSSTFVDNSTNNFTITPSGTVQPVTSPTPFPAKVDTTTLNSAYSTSLIGGSGYFDGTGDYLSVADNAAFALGTNSFTIEAWVYPQSAFANYTTIIAQSNNGAAASQSFDILVNSSGAILVEFYIGSTAYSITSGTNLVLNAWQHVAFVRNGNVFTLYLNGVSTGTPITNSGSINDSAVEVTVGAESTPFRYWNGYICNARIVNGTAIYTSAFAPPTSPLTSVTNTKLLVSATNAGIYDSTAKNVLETVGNAQISTTQSKYGGSSMSFNGTNSYLFIPNSPGLQLGSSDWTIECWVYLNSTTGDQRPISQNNSNYEFAFFMSSGGAMYAASYQSGGTTNFNISMGTLSTGQWYHLAASRSGSTVRAFVNGTLQNSATYSGTIDARTGGWRLGASYVPGDYFNGYINDARITKGYARYTTNFTPPTSQLQDQ